MNQKKLCDYGCGREAKYYFPTVDKWCCSASQNSCPEIRKKMSESRKGRIVWNKGKKGPPRSEESKKKQSESMTGKKGPPLSEEHKKKLSEAHTFTIEQWQEKYPDFCRAEEMRYNPNKLPKKEIQVHCIYSECENSKENGGWFTPSKGQFQNRRDALEHDNRNNGCYFFCSKKCKQECGYSDPNKLSEFKKYNDKVYKKTYKTIKKFSNKIKNIELQGKEYGYELDHKYTIYDGFKNNVDPKIVGHYKNLECISMKENREKNRNSSIALEELLNQIRECSTGNLPNIICAESK